MLRSNLVLAGTLAAAVNILGASNVRFTNCNLGVNFADNMGGAVKTVGSNVTFSNTAFYQNRVRPCWAARVVSHTVQRQRSVVFVTAVAVARQMTSWHLLQAATGGAIGMGPMSHIVLINSNFRWRGNVGGGKRLQAVITLQCDLV